MGIQDNIFDVEAALEGKPELELFQEIMERFYEIELRLLEYRTVDYCYIELKRALDSFPNTKRSNEKIF